MTDLSTGPALGTATTQGDALGALNAKTKARQRVLLVGGGGTAALLGLWFAFGGTDSAPAFEGVHRLYQFSLRDQREGAALILVAVIGVIIAALRRRIGPYEIGFVASIAILLRWLAHHSTAVFVAYRVALGSLVLVLAGAGTIA